MKVKRSELINYVISAGILILALVMTILEATKVFVLCAHPIWMFLMVLSAGFGIFTLVKAIMKKSSFYFMLSGFLFIYLLSYLLVDFTSLKWWLVLICAVVLAALLVLTSVFSSGNKTEAIALNKDGGNHKTYAERKAEEEKEIETPVELPKIKSFEEVNHPERKNNNDK